MNPTEEPTTWQCYIQHVGINADPPRNQGWEPFTAYGEFVLIKDWRGYDNPGGPKAPHTVIVWRRKISP